MSDEPSGESPLGAGGNQGGKVLPLRSKPKASKSKAPRNGVGESEPASLDKARAAKRRSGDLTIGGITLPVSVLEPGEMLVIEGGIDAEAFLHDWRLPDDARAKSEGAFEDGLAMARRLDRVRQNAFLEANDRDNAVRLLAHFPHDLIFVRGKGFFGWNGRYYDSETSYA